MQYIQYVYFNSAILLTFSSRCKDIKNYNVKLYFNYNLKNYTLQFYKNMTRLPQETYWCKNVAILTVLYWLVDPLWIVKPRFPICILIPGQVPWDDSYMTNDGLFFFYNTLFIKNVKHAKSHKILLNIKMKYLKMVYIYFNSIYWNSIQAT